MSLLVQPARGYQSNRIEVRLAILLAELIEFNRITGSRLAELIKHQSNCDQTPKNVNSIDV